MGEGRGEDRRPPKGDGGRYYNFPPDLLCVSGKREGGKGRPNLCFGGIRGPARVSRVPLVGSTGGGGDEGGAEKPIGPGGRWRPCGKSRACGVRRSKGSGRAVTQAEQGSKSVSWRKAHCVRKIARDKKGDRGEWPY